MDKKDDGSVVISPPLKEKNSYRRNDEDTVNTKCKKDIATALCDSAVLFIENEGKTSARYTLESDYVLNVLGFTHLAERIIRTNEKLFSIRTSQLNGRKYIASTKMGDQLLAALKTDVPSIRKFFPQHELNPYFELFVQHAQVRDLDYWHSIWEAVSKDEITKANDTLQGFVNALREEGRRASFKAKLRRFQRSANKNGQSLNRYLRKTLAHHSSINICRFDLGYRMNGASPIVQPCVTDHQTAKAHRETFLKALRKSEFSKYLIGYAWKVENSSAKGFLHHLLIILDEESAGYQSIIDDNLRKIWDEATASTGLLVDCSTLHPSFKSEGAGLLDNGNKDARVVIRKICTYLTQTDNYLKLDLPDGGRAFGRSEVVEKKNKQLPGE